MAGLLIDKNHKIITGDISIDKEKKTVLLGTQTYKQDDIFWYTEKNVKTLLDAAKLALTEKKYEASNLLIQKSMATEQKTKNEAAKLFIQLLNAEKSDGSFNHILIRDLNNKLQTFDGKNIESKTLLKVNYICLYFAASWSTPSHKHIISFTKKYTAMKKQYGDKFEVIMVNLDRDEKRYNLHLKKFKFPWPILKYKETFSILKKYQGSYIPLIVVLDKLANSLSEGKDPVKVLEIILATDSKKKIISPFKFCLCTMTKSNELKRN